MTKPAEVCHWDFALFTRAFCLVGLVDDRNDSFFNYPTLLSDAGHRLVPLKEKQRRPRDNNWNENVYSLDDLGRQLGLVIETGMVDVDLDWLELRAFATDGKSDTLTWGRPGKVTHLVYRAELREPITFKLPKVTGAPHLQGDHAYIVCEMRTSAAGEAHQAMIPGSMHPDGDDLEWFHKVVPQEVSPDAIVQT